MGLMIKTAPKCKCVSDPDYTVLFVISGLGCSNILEGELVDFH